MKRVFVFLFCSALLMAGPLQTTSEDFLDLTGPRPKQKVKLTGKGSGHGSVTTDGVPFTIPQLPFQVKLAMLDKNLYQIGDDLIYEVTLQNTGKLPFTIPWSVDLDHIKPDDDKDPPGFLRALISLVAKHESLGNLFVTGEVLFGSPLVPSSLKQIQPGHSVRIRMPGRWSLMGATSPVELPHAFEVHAEFSLLDDSRPEPYPPEASSNSFTVQLTKRAN